MSEHYTRWTTEAEAWCNKCQRRTTHAVSSGRLGRGTEHEAPKWSKRQVAAAEARLRDLQNPTLLDVTPNPNQEPTR